MTKIFRLFFLFCLISSIAFGQTQTLILTREQNTKWLDSLKTLALDQQLITIKDRLLSDTSVFVRQFYNDRIRVVDPIGSKVYGDGKPTLVIGGYPMIIDNKTETPKIIGLTKLLTNDFIKNINILSPNDPATTAIYGIAGMSGIIVMTLTKKKHLKKFRKLNLQSNGYRYT
jgi:uncharacterized membrane protein YuzA (DUF378 family)